MLWTFKQNSFSGGRLDKELMGRQDLAQYFKGATEIENLVVRRQGILSKRRGTRFVAEVPRSAISSGRFRLVPLVYSRDEGYYMLFLNGRIRLYDRNGFVSEIASTGIAASSAWPKLFDEMDYFQSGDTVYVVHKSFRPKRITFWRNAVSADDAWDGEPHAAKTMSIRDIDFQLATVRKPTSVTAAGSGMSSSSTSSAQMTISYTATYVDREGVESLPADPAEYSYTLPWPNTGRVKVTVSVKGDNWDDLDHLNIYKKTSTSFGLIGRITADEIAAKTEKGVFLDDYITPDLSITPPKDEDHFKEAGEYPSVVSVYQQRLVLGSSADEPFKFWMSSVGDLYNFNTHDSIREDDAISATLAATEMPEINHAVHTKDLMLFTNSGEWEVAPVSGNTLSYKTVSAKMQSAIGCAGWTKPIVIGDEIIFVDASGQTVYATRYNYASDGYESQDLTVLSQDLFRDNSIRRMDYKRHPDSEIVCVMDDGTLSTLAYMKEHDVCAWTRQRLGGGYSAVDVACSKAIHGATSETMLLVVSADGVYELWIVNDDCPYRGTSAVSDFVCLDRTIPIGAGETVPVGTRGVDCTTGDVVPAGGVMVHGGIRGIEIGSVMRTVYPEMQGGSDTIQMEVKNATETRIRTVESSTFEVHAVGQQTPTVVQISTTAANGAIGLQDMDVRVNLWGVNAQDGRIEIRHTAPYPLNILSIATTYQVESSNLNGSGNG